MAIVLRSYIKKGINLISPRLAQSMTKLYWRRRMRGEEEAVSLLLGDKQAIQVHSGVFANMHLLPRHSGSALLPKLLGTYEDELNPVIEEIVTAPYDTFIDIGAAEGYYAVGLALRMPTVQVYAYDVSQKARANCLELSRLNRVEHRVAIHESWSPQSLEKTAQGRTLIICDVEGKEREILDPALSDKLCKCDILVELHTQQAADTPRLIKERFAQSHEQQSFFAKEKKPTDYPVTVVLPEHLRAVSLDEMRIPGQEWVWMKARRGAPQ